MLHFFKSKPKPFQEAFRGKLYPAMDLLQDSIKEQKKTVSRLESDCQSLRQDVFVLQGQLDGLTVVDVQLLSARRQLVARYRKLRQEVCHFDREQGEIRSTACNMLRLLGKESLLILFGVASQKADLHCAQASEPNNFAMVAELDELVVRLNSERTLLERLGSALLLGMLVIIFSD